MFSLMGAGQNVPYAKALCRQIKCPHRSNFTGAAAPIAPMVPTPMVTITLTVPPPDGNTTSASAQFPSMAEVAMAAEDEQLNRQTVLLIF